MEILESCGNSGIEIHTLLSRLHLHENELTSLMKCINQLIDEHEVVEDEVHRYHALSTGPYFIGVLRMNERGFGFVEDGETSVYIHRHNLHDALEKDTVLIKVWQYEDGAVEGEIKQIITHAHQKMVGTYKKKQGKGYFLPDVSLNRKVKLLNTDEFSIVHDSKLLVEVVNFKHVLEAKIIKVLGHKYDPGMDILSLLYTHDIDPVFPDEVMEEVKQIPDSISEKELIGRTDLRNELIITIDGDDARDLDDAISVKKSEHGYQLSVHIADVSHYVKKGSAIDQEAYRRGTSVYVTDRVVPMLPHALCNGICSLLPKVDRLTITCEMEIDRNGEIVSYRIYPSVIRSSAQMTYRQINAMIDGDWKLQKEYEWLMGMLKDMVVVSAWIRKKREAGGAIDFDVKEGKVVVDALGKPTDVIVRERGEAERMIEDFMIQANICVARHTRWLDLPSMYRVHETPELKKLRTFQQTATIMGHKLKGNLADMHPMQLQQYLSALKGQDDYDVISALLLRSMQKAKYDVECKGHFGLALSDYTHFTSPIRRYPDLIVHRNLRKFYFHENYDVQQMRKESEWIEECADNCSKRERIAIEAERDVDDFKKAQYMESKIGHIYEGTIRSVMKFGMFVELQNTVEGLVHVSTMQDDYYIFDEAGRRFFGTRKQKIYQMGQTVKVKVADASRYKQQVDFVLVEEGSHEEVMDRRHRIDAQHHDTKCMRKRKARDDKNRNASQRRSKRRY